MTERDFDDFVFKYGDEFKRPKILHRDDDGTPVFEEEENNDDDLEIEEDEQS